MTMDKGNQPGQGPTLS